MRRIILFPGMGGSAAMHRGLKRADARLVLADWCDHHGCDSLSAYAERCIERFAITADDAVGGSSFGGMVAAEISDRRRVRALFLIGSCVSPESISPLLYRLAAIGAKAPFGVATSSVASLRRHGVAFGDIMSDHPAFIRWGCSALRRWTGVHPRVPTFHIHGGRDRIIPARLVAADAVIPNGGHLLALSHPFHVAAFIRAHAGDHEFPARPAVAIF
jgi:pimeloyl-ACP methyl ester carboxylesterase